MNNPTRRPIRQQPEILDATSAPSAPKKTDNPPEADASGQSKAAGAAPVATAKRKTVTGGPRRQQPEILDATSAPAAPPPTERPTADSNTNEARSVSRPASGGLRRQQPEILDATSVRSVPRQAAAPQPGRPNQGATTADWQGSHPTPDTNTNGDLSLSAPRGGQDADEPAMVPTSETRVDRGADLHMVPIEGHGGSSGNPHMVPIERHGGLSGDPGGGADDGRRSGTPAPEWERMKGRKSGDPDVTSAEGPTSSTPSPEWERMQRRKTQDADPVIDDADAASPADAAEWERMQRRKTQDADPAIEDEDSQKASSPKWQEMRRRHRVSDPGLQRIPREGDARHDAEAGSAMDSTDDPTGRQFDTRPAEAVVRSFTDELKTAARQTDSDITITQADRMKVEISSRERALVLFFAWRDLDFDRIVLRETPIPSTGEDEARKKSGLHGVRETLMKVLGRRPAGEEEQTTLLRVAPVRENGSPMLQWRDANQPNGSDDLVAKMRTAMAVRYVDPETGRDWFIELVSDGSNKGPNDGKGKAGRDLDVRGAKRNALLMLQGLMSAIDNDRSQN
jgi:hypothetical protein